MSMEANVASADSTVVMDKSLPAWPVWAAAVVMLLAFGLGEWLIPRRMWADQFEALHLDKSVPSTFADWKVDPDLMPILPDPTVEAKLNNLYSETLNRTYVLPSGIGVMLSIAYGRNQNSESTAAHRPEFCYTAQGFMVERLGVKTLNIQGHRFQAVQLLAVAGSRIEPITYWVTLGPHASIPGLDRKLKQLQYGLQGWIVDGMLMRVSTVMTNREPASLDKAFILQEQFLSDMVKAMKPEDVPRFFGS